MDLGRAEVQLDEPPSAAPVVMNKVLVSGQSRHATFQRYREGGAHGFGQGSNPVL